MNESSPAARSGALRVMTWNLHGLGRPWLASRGATDAAVGVLRAAEPDVVGIQERPRGPFGRRRLRVVAARTGLRVVVGGGAARTTALLARPDRSVTGARGLRLRWTPTRTRRGASTARVEGVEVLVVHLGLDAAERAQHLRLLLRRRASGAWPLVVLGDLNELPGSPSWRALEAAGLVDAAVGAGPTFPAARPAHRIDAVLVGYGLGVTEARVLDDRAARAASDHLPVLVDLVLPAPGQAPAQAPGQAPGQATGQATSRS